MDGNLVIRFGSLGDLCLLGSALAELRDGPPPADAAAGTVTLVTKPAFADLMRCCHGIDRVVAPAGTGMVAVAALAGRLRRQRFARIVDAHDVLRSRWLLTCLGRRPAAVLAKDTTARLRLLRTGRADPRLRRTMSDRFAEVLAAIDPARAALASPARRPPSGSAPLPALRGLAAAGRADAGGPPVLGLAPGAQWDPKRWPAESFAELAERFLRETSGTVRIYLGPREERWFSGSPLDRPGGWAGRAAVVRGRPLPEVAASLAGCTLLATNDSGLLHLAEAVGTPVLAFFGPTVREFGYFPRLAASRVLEVAIGCRPCSRNGKRPCRRRDLACLTWIPPEQAWLTLQQMLAAPTKELP